MCPSLSWELCSRIRTAKWGGGEEACVVGTRTIMWDSARYPGDDHLPGVHAWCPSVPCKVSSRVSVSFHPRCERQSRGLLSPPSRDACISGRQKQERANQSIRPDLLQLREGDAPAVITWLWGLWLESTPPSLASEALVLIEAHGSRPQRISADAGV